MKSDTAARHPVLEGDSERVRLLATGNLVDFAGLLDDDLVYVHSTGLIHGKAELIRFFTETLQVLDLHTRVAHMAEGGDMASLGLFQGMRGRLRTDPARELHTQSYVSEVWRQRGGEWRLLHFQSTAIGEAPPPR